MNRLRLFFKHIGPALVLTTVVLGPGSLTLNTMAGSQYGYRLLWVPVIATVFMILYTWMSARVGLVTGKTLFQNTRDKYGAGLARISGVFGFLAVLAFQAGNSAAVGFVGNAAFGGDPRLWAFLFFLPALGMMFLPNLYNKLELLVKLIVGLMLLTFVGTLIIVGIDTEAAARGLIPQFPDGPSVFLTLGMAATTFSIAAAVYQSYLMREKKWGPEHLGTEGADTFIGIGFLGMISIVVLLTSAGVLSGTTQQVFNAEGMIMQLEPLVGPAAKLLFLLGFFFAAFSSLIVNPLIGATLLVDGLGQESSMDGRPVRMWTIVGLVAGLAVVLIFKGSPVELIRTAQGLAVVAFPLLGFIVLGIARDREIMGAYANRGWTHALALVGYLGLLGIVFNNLRLVVNTFF